MTRNLAKLLGSWALIIPAVAAAAESDARPRVRFNVDVRPVLADACFACHGPDANARQADLRLDTQEGLFGKREGDVVVVVPGQSQASELYRRITSRDPYERMPPPDAERKLSPRQIDLLTRWIEEGAVWEGHWAFEPVKGPVLQRVSQQERSRNGIDAFVLAVLDRRGLSPAAQASAETLLRRVTLDLTGLPPTPEETDAYLADASPARYERAVDRLLASPSYGEHMAVAWLDAARFADTSGYQTDGSRDMSRWRDWLIAALNAGMPYDQFTVEQLAGDLLPNATLDQKIATGFHRNHRANSEGGSIPEEFLVEYVVDRVDTTGTVWLGLSIGCARCHDHKYDPISQKEYYELFAYFNNLPESGRALKEGNSPPYVLSPNITQQRELHEIDSQLAMLTDQWEHDSERRHRAQFAWERSVKQEAADTAMDWTVEDGLIAWYPLRHNLLSAIGDRASQTTAVSADGQLVEGGLHMSRGESEFVNGERESLRLDGRQFVDAGDVGNFGYFDSFTVSAWVKPRGDLNGGLVTRMTDDSDRTGWALHLQNGHVQVHLVKRWLDDAIRVETKATLVPEQWHHVLMTYDGSRVAEGIRIFIDGRLQQKNVLLDQINQSIEIDQPLRIGSIGMRQPFAGDIADVRVYDRALSGDEAMIVSVSEPVDALLAIPPDDRTIQQATKVREHFLLEAGPVRLRQHYAALQNLQQQRKQFLSRLSTTMVMTDMSEPRQTFILGRGSYDNPTVPVSADVPAVLQQSPRPVGDDRLALARWLVDPSHPLTARVAVNREWQRFFGTGIVKTAEDFGTQGERPSHPDLLDWLASEFVRTGWDMKGLHRLIVTSATYRQSSVASPELAARDPENRLLARGPRFRMTAEMIRDQALATGGLLQHRIGGPSVKPYQPDGLWAEISTDKVYERSTGPDLYRRSLYSFIKRTVVNPTYGVFDATTRETCLVRRSRTNTPLQALALMNDVTFVEAARALAERVLNEGGSTPIKRLRYAFLLTLARPPSEAELNVLIEALKSHVDRYAADAAEKLLNIGESTPDPALDQTELAAYTALMNVLMNLDETVTKE